MNPIREEISERYPDLLVMDPTYLDAAIIGVATRIGLEAVCYDLNKLIRLLVEHDGMEEDEAMEYIDFNMRGAWVGEHTPVFLE
jgi:hypothetical protein